MGVDRSLSRAYGAQMAAKPAILGRRNPLLWIVCFASEVASKQCSAQPTTNGCDEDPIRSLMAFVHCTYYHVDFIAKRKQTKLGALATINEACVIGNRSI